MILTFVKVNYRTPSILGVSHPTQEPCVTMIMGDYVVLGVKSSPTESRNSPMGSGKYAFQHKLLKINTEIFHLLYL